MKASWSWTSQLQKSWWNWSWSTCFANGEAADCKTTNKCENLSGQGWSSLGRSIGDNRRSQLKHGDFLNVWRELPNVVLFVCWFAFRGRWLLCYCYSCCVD